MKVHTRNYYTTCSTSRGPREQHWHIELYVQPWKDYWYNRLYHFYDMWIPIKIPGYKWLCKLFEWRGAEVRPRSLGEAPRGWMDRFRTWSMEQDFKCYENGERNKKVLGAVEVDPVLYQKIK
jgi:hypothetical protein